MSKQVEVPDGLAEFIRAWCDGHKQRDPEAWAWADYETWQRDDMIETPGDSPGEFIEVGPDSAREALEAALQAISTPGAEGER